MKLFGTTIALIVAANVAVASPPRAAWCDNMIEFRFGVVPDQPVANRDRADFFAMLLHMSNYRSIELVEAHLSHTPWSNATIFDLNEEGACVAFFNVGHTSK